MLSRQEMIRHFGKAGGYFYDAVRGVDHRPVVSLRERKSIGAERTFETDLYESDAVKEKLSAIIDIVWGRCEKQMMFGKTVTLKLRFADFTTITRSNTQNEALTREEAAITLERLLPMEEIKERGVRLLGATMSHFPSDQKGYVNQLRIDFDEE
jgi:DNA polymerase-4